MQNAQQNHTGSWECHRCHNIYAPHMQECKRCNGVIGGAPTGPANFPVNPQIPQPIPMPPYNIPPQPNQIWYGNFQGDVTQEQINRQVGIHEAAQQPISGQFIQSEAPISLAEAGIQPSPYV